MFAEKIRHESLSDFLKAMLSIRNIKRIKPNSFLFSSDIIERETDLKVYFKNTRKKLSYVKSLSFYKETSNLSKIKAYSLLKSFKFLRSLQWEQGTNQDWFSTLSRSKFLNSLKLKYVKSKHQSKICPLETFKRFSNKSLKQIQLNSQFEFSEKATKRKIFLMKKFKNLAHLDLNFIKSETLSPETLKFIGISLVRLGKIQKFNLRSHILMSDKTGILTKYILKCPHLCNFSYYPATEEDFISTKLLTMMNILPFQFKSFQLLGEDNYKNWNEFVAYGFAKLLKNINIDSLAISAPIGRSKKVLEEIFSNIACKSLKRLSLKLDILDCFFPVMNVFNSHSYIIKDHLTSFSLDMIGKNNQISDVFLESLSIFIASFKKLKNLELFFPISEESKSTVLSKLKCEVLKLQKPAAYKFYEQIANGTSLQSLTISRTVNVADWNMAFSIQSMLSLQKNITFLSLHLSKTDKADSSRYCKQIGKGIAKLEKLKTLKIFNRDYFQIDLAELIPISNLNTLVISKDLLKPYFLLDEFGLNKLRQKVYFLSQLRYLRLDLRYKGKPEPMERLLEEVMLYENVKLASFTPELLRKHSKIIKFSRKILSEA